MIVPSVDKLDKSIRHGELSSHTIEIQIEKLDIEIKNEITISVIKLLQIECLMSRQ